ncbi:MAG TPA: hypothetical protein VNJ02_10565 [Vicinamibacterales bacterium]|nr:hypothetical protein [Vicinamibacterales bacterium]
MKLMRCIVDEGGTVNVQGATFGRTFGRGAVVDFTEKADAKTGLTWRDAIGKPYAHLFEPVVDTALAKKSAASRDVATE